MDESRVSRRAPRRRFCLHGVTGPDEYSALVDNNLYTNLMARANLRAAAELADRLGLPAVEVSAAEVAAWRRAADAMTIPYDEQLDVHLQDEHFAQHEPWDFAATPPESYPLLLHFPYLELYRRQVIKQPDLVLAMHLRGDMFTLEQKRRNFAYYESLTVRDWVRAPTQFSRPSSVISASLNTISTKRLSWTCMTSSTTPQTVYTSLPSPAAGSPRSAASLVYATAMVSSSSHHASQHP